MDKLITYTCPEYKICLNQNNGYEPSLLYILSKIYHSYFLYDRFFNLNNNFEFNLSNTKDDFFKILSEKYLNFEECCYKRTDEIIDLSLKLNKDIWISYSGGVDSTLVVCAFLLNDKLDKSKFHVLYNTYSVNEYPDFFNMLVKNKIHVVDTKLNYLNIDEYSKNDILVSGMCGDQLDGSNLCTKKYNNYSSFHNWIDIFGDFKIETHKCLKTYKKFDEYVNIIEKYAHNIFFDNIRTFNEFAWLFNFCCKWKYISDYMCMMSSKHIYRLAFFDTIYFQKWCLYHIRQKFEYAQDNPLNYKIDWKKLIYSYTKDESYLLNKRKDATYLSNRDLPPYFIVHDEKSYNVYSYKINIIKIMKQYIKYEYQDLLYIENIF